VSLYLAGSNDVHNAKRNSKLYLWHLSPKIFGITKPRNVKCYQNISAPCCTFCS